MEYNANSAYAYSSRNWPWDDTVNSIMVISRLASYLVSTAILLMSAYMQSVLLFPNVSMFARSVEVVTNGQIAWVEVIIIAWISSICMLVGYLYLKNSDIINKHR